MSFINKTTGQVLVTETFEQMFGPPAGSAYLDPTVNFDPQYNQFVLTTLNGADANTTALDFALIPDSNPTTFQWAQYSLANAASPPPYGDFDHVGWNNDAYFIAMNMPASTWDGSYVMTVQKVDVHSSAPPSTYQSLAHLPDYKSDSSLNFLNYSVQPAIMHDGPSGQMWFVGTPVPTSAFSSLRVRRGQRHLRQQHRDRDRTELQQPPGHYNKQLPAVLRDAADSVFREPGQRATTTEAKRG